jgi:hypothetical protein
LAFIVLTFFSGSNWQNTTKEARTRMTGCAL